MDFCLFLLVVSFFDHAPIHNLPQCLQLCSTPILVIQVIRMLPDIESQDRLEAAGDGVAGVGFLGDDEGATGGRGEPDPAGAEEADALGDEVGFEGVDAAPLFFDLLFELTRRPFDGLRDRRLELREIQVVVQNLTGVVEDGPIGLGDDLFQRQAFEGAAGKELVQVVHIGLQVLAVVEADGVGADDRCQRIGSVRELNQCEHAVEFKINLLFPMEFFIDGKRTRSGLSYPGKEVRSRGLRTQARGYSYKFNDYY